MKTNGLNAIKLGNALKEVIGIYFTPKQKKNHSKIHYQEGIGEACNIGKRNKACKHPFKMCLIVPETCYKACSI